jgi:putative transposase
MISIARTHSRNVKHWQSGNTALRWCAAGMAEAGKQFRRVNGHLHLAALQVGCTCRNGYVTNPLTHNNHVRTSGRCHCACHHR